MQPRRRTGSLVAFLALIAFSIALLLQRQAIADWLKLRNYAPSAEIVQLATVTTMTNDARRLFYVNHPKILDKAEFNQSCPDNGREHTIVLGCYHGNDSGIFIYNVTEPQLDGVEQVTAAHEMLHAAYQRLGDNDKRSVDNLLQEFFANNLNDERIRGVIEAYKKTSPAELVNEMHSIFGTEIANLTPALEDYYKRYFGGRQQVVNLAARYQRQFTDRKNQIAAYDSELTGLKQQIDTNQKRLDSMGASINAERSRLDGLLAARQYEAYNAAVPGFNQQVVAYNNLVKATRVIIERYNVIVDQRNAILIEEQALQKALDSNTTEPTE